MAGGSYNVEQAEACPSKKDNSFKSCICALLVVLAICLIGLLVTTILGLKRTGKEVKLT